jgi:hypothetical protein
MTNTNAEIIEFPGKSYRAAIGENWFDGTYEECLAWCRKYGATRIKMTAWR